MNRKDEWYKCVFCPQSSATSKQLPISLDCHVLNECDGEAGSRPSYVMLYEHDKCHQAGICGCDDALAAFGMENTLFNM